VRAREPIGSGDAYRAGQQDQNEGTVELDSDQESEGAN